MKKEKSNYTAKIKSLEQDLKLAEEKNKLL